MRYGSLFSGVGGFDRGLDLAGHECAFQVELDPFCQRVLAERWPDVPRFNDVRTVHQAVRKEVMPPEAPDTLDLLVGGFP